MAAYEMTPVSDQVERPLQNVADACRMMAKVIEANVPKGREKSLAFTKLEELMLWSAQGIVEANRLDRSLPVQVG